ncbi:hypothetical protein OAM86_03475 [Porticoccaceae bacterium]|nr:hypothetical protein [Porticoccaceae bacterium]
MKARRGKNLLKTVGYLVFAKAAGIIQALPSPLWGRHRYRSCAVSPPFY